MSFMAWKKFVNEEGSWMVEWPTNSVEVEATWERATLNFKGVVLQFFDNFPNVC